MPLLQTDDVNLSFFKTSAIAITMTFPRFPANGRRKEEGCSETSEARSNN
jgi:hypothetical protein